MRKLTRTAASRVYPMARPKVMVPPERETPGINASIWPMPKISASFQVISFMVLTCLERASTTHSSTPNNASTVTVIHRLRSDPSIACLNSRPVIRIGIVPRMMNQPICVSGLCAPIRLLKSLPSLPNREPNHAPRMRMMSCRKYKITASSVPIWMIAVNAAPGSDPSIKSPIMRICALEETGRYSVNACTRPRKIAWKKFMNPLLYVSMVSSAFPHPRLARGV